MGQYSYNTGNAATFNQLVRTGLTVEEASDQSGVSLAASSYGLGSNANAGAVIPGAGGATTPSGLVSVSYPQSGTGRPGQQPTQISTPAAGYSTFQDPAQLSGQNALTIPQPGPSPFAAFSRVETVPIIAPAPSTFQDPAQRAAAAAPTVPVQETPAPSPFAAFSRVEIVPQPLQTPVAEPSPFAADPAQAGKIVADAAAQASPFSAFERVVTVPATIAPDGVPPTYVPGGAPPPTVGSTPIGAETITPASDTEAGKLLAQRQQVLAAQKKLVNNNGDWRVRVSLAENSDYLYNAPFPDLGILAPLKATYGVIFPYTPKIDIGYKATYSNADLTHSNYTNYFYQSSSVGQVRITGTFTAQDTVEADYLLAVIHFFRSAGKMFYGQDAQRGAPPPLLFISGLGEYQFNNHPCVLTSFEYNLPADVDYIRAGSPNDNGTDLLKRRTATQNNLPTNAFSGALSRLNQLFSGQGIQKGGLVYQNAPSNLSKNSPTYVPTKIDISVGLLPIVTRNQASRQFSLKQFANGDLVKQGYW